MNESCNCCNARLKVYNDGSVNYLVCRGQIFKRDKKAISDIVLRREERFNKFNSDIAKLWLGLEKETTKSNYDLVIWAKKNLKMGAKRFHVANIKNDPREDSIKRANDSIFDYILNNEFSYFFTGTIDPNKLDSKDPKALLQPVQKWLQNSVTRYGMSYILIAERHKSGRIHFHGLFRSEKPFPIVYSGTDLYKGCNVPLKPETAAQRNLENPRPVYNLKAWKFGFSTCIPLVGDRLGTAFYVTKYITKDCKKIFGKFFGIPEIFKSLE